MCIIIDACTFSRVFGDSDEDFSPVRLWLMKGKGMMVFGGSTYAKELGKLRSYLEIVKELSRLGKVKVINKKSVDTAERRVRLMEPNKDFDDPHIVAIVEESGCKLVCTLDARADKYIRDARFYEKGKRPSIYRSKSHAHLLCARNIVGVCG
jgi:hypothetical protein